MKVALLEVVPRGKLHVVSRPVHPPVRGRFPVYCGAGYGRLIRDLSIHDFKDLETVRRALGGLLCQHCESCIKRAIVEKALADALEKGPTV